MDKRQRVNKLRPVDAADRAEVIDAVDRLNLAFDVWDIETMVDAFAEDGEVVHPRGNIRGHAALRTFYEGYRALTLGVRRQNLNHVVDENEDGTLTVQCYNMLIRVAAPAEAEQTRHAMLTALPNGLPAILMHSMMSDTLRREQDGAWRIVRREVVGTVSNPTIRMEV